jgi:hypothetical protein
VEGSCRGLLEVLFQFSLGRTEKDHVVRIVCSAGDIHTRRTSTFARYEAMSDCITGKKIKNVKPPL